MPAISEKGFFRELFFAELAMASPPPLLVVLAVLAAAAAAITTEAAIAVFGMNYGRVGDNLPSPIRVADLARKEGIASIKIFDADLGVLQAFSGSGIRMVTTVPNDAIARIASSTAAASAWLDAGARPFLSQIDAILVGNEVLKFSPHLAPLLVPAMSNLRQALLLDSSPSAASILVSTPHAMDIIERNSSWPPSAGVFKRRHSAVLAAMIDFLASSGAPFMLNAYPYFAYREDKARTLRLPYALGLDGAVTALDPVTNLVYASLLDAQLDAVYSAIRRLSPSTSVGILLAETGWPTAGGFGATPANAQTYTANLIRRASNGRGTPQRPDFPVHAFAFALFNEDLKHNLMEQSFGIFYPNMSKVYPVQFKAVKH